MRLRVLPSDNRQEAPAVLRQGESRLMSIGDISVIAGLPKSRKTFLVSYLIAAYFNGYGGLSSDTDDKLLLIDTEQSEQHLEQVVKRIYRLLGWSYTFDCPSFIALSTRKFGAKDRLFIVEKAINELTPSFVIIDGFADLLDNTNDIEASTQVISKLMALSSNNQCHICSVLHTNPNSDKMRGHAGSELQRKAESVLLVTKSEEITTITPQFCRNVEFKKFAFRIDNGLPVPCDYTPTPEDNTRMLFESILSMEDDGLRFKDLKKIVMDKCNVKEAAAESRIRKATQAAIIKKDKDNLYHLHYEDLPE